jgi:hypothetical protein
MNARVKRILDEVRDLPESERRLVVEGVLLQEEPSDDAWTAEMLDRAREATAHGAELLEAEDVYAEALAELARARAAK